MRAVVQRVSRAAVTIRGEVVGSIGPGLLALVGIRRGDDEAAGRWLCDKLLRLRVFEDGEGKMNRTVTEAGGGILLVSQFTLYGDVRKGNRPGFDEAAPKEEAEPLYDRMVAHLRDISPVPVATGRFCAEMAVDLVNDGPVTILLER
ncbi:MAG TPA: D-aminoacyl-tRNA deacylase [Candidatus Deferrimicrobiaceae bacterium]